MGKEWLRQTMQMAQYVGGLPLLPSRDRGGRQHQSGQRIFRAVRLRSCSTQLLCLSGGGPDNTWILRFRSGCRAHREAVFLPADGPGEGEWTAIIAPGQGDENGKSGQFRASPPPHTRWASVKMLQKGKIFGDQPEGGHPFLFRESPDL